MFSLILVYENVDAQAVLAALSNNAVPLTAKGPEKPVVSRSALAQGEQRNMTYDDDEPVPNREGSALEPSNVLFAFKADTNFDTLAYNLLRNPKQSSDPCFWRCTSELISEVGSFANGLGARNSYFFPVKNQGSTPTLEDFLRLTIEVVSASPLMEETLFGTPFMKDATNILKAILLGDWAMPGFLSATSSTGTKADLAKFLKEGESMEDSSCVLASACRVVRLLGYILGPLAYRSWYMELLIQVPEHLHMPTVHAGALKDALTQHLQAFSSVGTTNDIKSYRERGGSLADYVKTNLTFTPSWFDNLVTKSNMRIAQVVLSLPKPVDNKGAKLLTPPATKGQLQSNLRQPAGSNNNAKKPSSMTGLKGFCLPWLQSNHMPCSNSKCAQAQGGKGLRHRVEWDAFPATDKELVLVLARKLTPGGHVKVQP